MTNDATQIDTLVLREIPNKRKYWFVRTFGGQLFDYYYDKNIVGISGNSVPIAYINNALHDDVTYSTLHSFIQKNINETQSEATKLANQLISFVHDMSIGDIVIIPSEDSSFLAFGEITSNLKIQESKASLKHNEKIEPYPEKVRSVKWLKIMNKQDVVGDIRPLLSSHLGLTNADRFGEFIEGNLSTFFQKDNHYYSTLYIDLSDEQELNAFELYRYLESLTKLYRHYCAENDIEYNEELFLKIKVQSPGNAIFKWAMGIAGVSFMGIIAMSVVGIDPQVELKQNRNGNYEFKASAKGNFLSNKAQANKIEQATEAKRVTDSLAAEDKKLEQLLKRKENGLLSPEERIKYQQQLIDTSKALNVSSVESKEVSIKEVN